MKVEPSGVVMIGVCDIQTPKCTAKNLAAVTAIWTSPGRSQINVCRECLEEMIRSGQWEIPNARISRHIDVAAVDPNNKLILAIEVKRRPLYDRNIADYARRIHRNLLSHGVFPGLPYFMIVFVPTPAFLWTPKSFLEPESQPEFSLDISEDIEGILDTIKGSPDEDPLIMEKVVANWLEIAIVNMNREEGYRPEWLVKSGLFEKLKEARILREYRM